MKPVSLDLMFPKEPPDPTDPDAIGTVIDHKNPAGMRDYVWHLCNLWAQRKPAGTYPKLLYIPRGEEPFLREWLEGVAGHPVAFITHLHCPVAGHNCRLKIVYFKPREGPRYTFDGGSLFLR